MSRFALALRRKQGGVDLRQMAVHVPFDIRNRRGRQNIGYRSNNIVAYIPPRQIENKLIPPHRMGTIRHMETPVGMTPVEFAVQ
ncbi:hypothetical protein D3C87_1933780 [compost metagenome]